MREIVEFRVDEQFAPILFAEGEGRRGTLVRIVEMESTDPRFTEVGRLQRELRQKEGKPFFYGWSIKRRYGARELNEARLFALRVAAVFEPAGEQCGTRYDESSACPICGAGANQIGPLMLDVSRIPRGKDFAATIAGEIVVSQRAVDVLGRYGIIGLTLSPVRGSAGSSEESREWFQLGISSASAEIVAPTRVGINPFDDDSAGKYRCTRGDLIGLNLISEVTVRATARECLDMVSSRQFVGTRRGLLRPRRVIFVSPRFRKMLVSETLKGVEVERAHLVEPPAGPTKSFQ